MTTTTSPDLFAIGLALADGVRPSEGINWYDPEVVRGRLLGTARKVVASAAAWPDWTPTYSPWRHGGWYVDNLQYPSGAVGCVSRNYSDKKWRIACGDHERTFSSRDDAARAERLVAISEALAIVAGAAS